MTAHACRSRGLKRVRGLSDQKPESPGRWLACL